MPDNRATKSVTMLKSSFFSGFDADSDEATEFKRGLAAALTLPDHVLRRLALDLPHLAAIRTEALREKFVHAQVAELGIDRVAAGLVFGFMTPLLDNFAALRPNDEPEALADDAQELKLVGASERTKLEFIFTLLKSEVFPELLRQTRLREAEVGVFPSLASVRTTVEVRAVLHDRFKTGGDAPAHVIGVVGAIPVASIAISVDTTPDLFCFQCDPVKLQWLIDKLLITKREMDAFSAHLSLGDAVPEAVREQRISME